MIGLPEIRHKTAVSTIRSTAERAAHREKSNKQKVASDVKRKSSHEISRGISATSVDLLY